MRSHVAQQQPSALNQALLHTGVDAPLPAVSCMEARLLLFSGSSCVNAACVPFRACHAMMTSFLHACCVTGTACEGVTTAEGNPWDQQTTIHRQA